MEWGSSKDCVLAAGFAQLPKGTTLYEIQKVIGCVLVIDKHCWFPETWAGKAIHAYGGGPGFKYIITKFIPRLLDEGITQEQIDTIFVKNPARWLAF